MNIFDRIFSLPRELRELIWGFTLQHPFGLKAVPVIDLPSQFSKYSYFVQLIPCKVPYHKKSELITWHDINGQEACYSQPFDESYGDEYLLEFLDQESKLTVPAIRPSDAPLLFVNKQLREESLPQFFSFNEFKFWATYTDRPTHFVRWVERKFLAQKAKVRKISPLVVHNDAQNVVAAIRREVSPFKSLKILFLTTCLPVHGDAFGTWNADNMLDFLRQLESLERVEPDLRPYRFDRDWVAPAYKEQRDMFEKALGRIGKERRTDGKLFTIRFGRLAEIDSGVWRTDFV